MHGIFPQIRPSGGFPSGRTPYLEAVTLVIICPVSRNFSGGKNKYEQNARRLVTRWGPPVDDYAAKIWSGLIRDYYLPRWEHFIQSRLSEKIRIWEHGRKNGSVPLA